MATNTTATATTHTGNGSTTNFAISFSFLANNEVDVTVAGVLKTLDTHYTISGSTVTFTAGNTPDDNAAIKFQRDTNISAKKVDFQDGSVLTESDLDTNSDQVLFAQQEITDKVNGIEEGATGDQTAAEIRTLVESATDSNVFTDADHTKLNGIETAATADQTAAEIRALVESASDSNVFTDADHSKLNAIEASATADQTAAEIRTLVESASDSNVFTDADHTKLNAIEANATADQTVSEIKSLIAGSPLDSSHLAANSVDSSELVDGSIDHSHLSNDCVDGDNIADNSIGAEHLQANSVDSSELIDGSIDTSHLSADCVDGTKIADNAIGSEHLAANSVDSSELVDGSVDHSHLSNDCVDGDNIADNSIGSEHLQANSVGVSEIADAELTTLAGMQSGTASKLADSTALTADIADLNQIDGLTKQTTISDSDASFPTSGAVVDYVAAQIAPIGGLEVIANDQSFPNTQPSAGVVISIADAGGLVVSTVNGVVKSTTGRTAGGTEVTINNIASNFNNTTVDAGVAMMVSSTGSGHIYNYHKATLKEADLLSLSGDINDFAERYRVENTLPAANSSTNHDGDLVWAKDVGKMYVYSGDYDGTPVGSFGEVQSIGNFFISTLSPAFNGSLQDFTITNAPSSAEQIILSINGVIQKPNAGSSTPSEGFALSGSTVKLAAAPASGSDYFAVVIGSTVNIGTPSDNTVTSAILQNGSVVEAKLGSGAVTQAKIGDQAINEAKLQVSNAPTNGYFLSAQSGNTGGLTWAQVSTDVVSDTSPQLGGTLDTNGQDVNFIGDTSGRDVIFDASLNQMRANDNAKLCVGTSSDLEIYHSGSASYIDNYTGALYLRNNVSSDVNGDIYIQAKSGENSVACYDDGAVELYYNNSKKLETQTGGTLTTGTVTSNLAGGTAGQGQLNLGSSGAPYIRGFDTGNHGSGSKIEIISGDGDDQIICKRNGAVELFYDASKKFETTSSGATLTGDLTVGAGANSSNIYMNDSDETTRRIHCNSNRIGFLDSSNDWSFYSDNTGNCSVKGHLYPDSHNNYDIGGASNRWRNVYTGDLHLSNKGSSNDVDGTWGSYTIQEGTEDLFLINKRNGKKYKFNLTEVS